MKLKNILHTLSYLSLVFFVWVLILLTYIFFFNPENPMQSIGNVLFIGGFLMGFASLSDITKMSEKERKKLANPKFAKRKFYFLLAGPVILVIISIIFHSIQYIFPLAEKSILANFTKLGYDCLVMLLGYLGLLKQFVEKVEYAKSISENRSAE